MTSLFDKNQRYTTEANCIANLGVTAGIGAAFAYAKQKGYSFREVSCILVGEISTMESAFVLGLDDAKDDWEEVESNPCQDPSSPTKSST